MGKYIDSNGLSHLIGLFKPALLPSGGSAGQVLVKGSATDYDVGWATSSGGSASTYYATCSTAAATAAKAITVAGWTPAAGDLLAVYFTTANTVSGQITLNVNSTGAKVVYLGNSATSATNPLLWDAGDVLLFVYATYWRFLGRDKARVSQTVTTGTEIATVDGTPIYAPSGGGSDKVDTESTNGTDTATIDNTDGAVLLEATDGTDTSSVTVEPTGVTIASSGIEAGRAMITGASGDVQTSSVTSTELHRLSGITSNVQNQIDALQSALDALDTWETVALSDFATIASGWTFVTSGCNVQFNAALGAVRVRLQVQTAAAQTAGSKTLFTVKSAYRPKTFPAAVPSITVNAQTAQIRTAGGFSPIVAAISAGTSLYFNGVYFIGS